MRKNCSSDREKLLKFEAEGREFVKFLRSLEQFIQTVKREKILGFRNMQEKLEKFLSNFVDLIKYLHKVINISVDGRVIIKKIFVKFHLPRLKNLTKEIVHYHKKN